MTNTELMRKFFYNLPELLFSEGQITQKQFDSFTNEQMIEFIDGLHMDYPTKELQEQFEHNKNLWKLYYQMPKDSGIAFI